MAKGILIAAMDFSDVAEDEFHDWYDTEHVPERLRVPGFLNAERWIGTQDPKVSLALYDLDTVGVLHSPAYLAVGGANGTPWTRMSRRSRKASSTSGTTRSTCRSSARCPASWRPGVTAAPARRSAMRRSIISPIPMCRIHKLGRARPTRPGPSACGRISAICYASTPAAMGARPDRLAIAGIARSPGEAGGASARGPRHRSAGRSPL